MRIFLSLPLILLSQCLWAGAPVPPKAKSRPHQLEKHSDVRQDEFFWLKDRKNPEVIQYLKAENRYTDQVMKATRTLQKKLFAEMKARVKEDDSTYPVQNGDYHYYTRFEKGREYPLYARKKGLTAAEEIIFDINKEARGHSFYSANYSISPSHNLAALVFDTTGRRFYSVKFKDLKTGRFLKNSLKDVTGNLAWAPDSETLFYTKQDAETLRSYQVYRYHLPTAKSELIYEEKTDTFEAYVSSSLSRKHIFIHSYSTLSNETRTIPADKPNSEPQLIYPREREHEFSVTEDMSHFYILSNKNAKDFQILRASFSNPAQTEVWLAHRPGVHLDDILVLKDYVVLESRENGLTQLEVIDKNTKKIKKLSFADSAYTVELGSNAMYEQTHVRYSYDSMRSPVSIYDYDFTEEKSTLRKAKEVPTYNPELYSSERVFARARDGVMVPVSILSRKDTLRDGSAPLLIYGYGSYGATLDPWFSSNILSLVDRGYIYAIAHVRGGGEMGRHWTDGGRTLKKKNTFTDFIDCTEFLIAQKYAHPKKVFAMGGSAGGLLMGAIANMRPDLYKGIVAQVPFVDVVTTMLDDSIPLTTAEYDEWGNPNVKEFYDYMKSYSPYDNVTTQAYPHILVTTGLHDSQVQYWEPAKWVARLRKMNTAKSILLLQTDMAAGHGGKSGRFDQLKEDALEYAFILEMEKK